MALAARLQARLRRGPRGADPRRLGREGRLATRLQAREVARDRDRPEPGSTLRFAREVVDRSLRAVEAGPNAPLLIRVVRYPYALRPGDTVRVQGRPSVELAPPVRDRGLVFRSVVAELWAAHHAPSVVKGLSFRPVARPSPFARARS
jgi:hypothetical protein